MNCEKLCNNKGDLFLKILFCSISSPWCSLISDYKYDVLSDAMLWEMLYPFFPSERKAVSQDHLGCYLSNESVTCTQARNFFQDADNECETCLLSVLTCF